jgi:glutamate--cysteine ligase
MSEQSLQAQQQLETRQQVDFDQYLENYYNQYRGCRCEAV